MMATYTPGRLTEGPLAVDYFYGGADLKRADGVVIAIEMSHDDARRLAACWNACEGIPTDYLEAPEADASVIAKKAYTEVVALRDQLAAARALLTEAMAEVPANYSDPMTRRIRAFLAGEGA